jgi:AraC family transcriptional regulator of adaptative response/methylated-DNA-[protein]-cysteine methyltransferase
MTLRFTIDNSSIGFVLVAASEKGICSIMLGDDSQQLMQDLKNRFPKMDFIPDAALKKIIQYVENPAMNFDLVVDIKGTSFQKKVWTALKKIPYGTTVSYTDIAKQIDAPKSVRAVAQACGANPLAVVVPCHRVVGKNGALSGYRWGISRKQILLRREAQ